MALLVAGALGAQAFESEGAATGASASRVVLTQRELAALAPAGPLHRTASRLVDGPMVFPGKTEPPLSNLCTAGTVAAPAPLPGASSGGPGGMPKPGIGFLGLSASPGGFGGDISGAAGPSNYVQTINDKIGIFSRNGTLLCTPVDTGALWAGGGHPCDIGSWTDAIVLYDQQAQRWFISRFVNDQSSKKGNWFQCFAVSKTSDPTGTYFRYAFPISRPDFEFFNDYPKLGIWRDAYYMTTNARACCPPADNVGIFVTAFQRSAMLQGHLANAVQFFLPRPNPIGNVNRLSTMQPASFDGPNLPPKGSPEFLVQALDDNMGWPADRLAVWAFHVSWSNPGSSKLRIISLEDVDHFDSNVCESATASPATNQSCIVQRGTTQRLDPLAYGFSGYRLVYRRFTTVPSGLSPQVMVFAQTVAVGSDTSHTGIRWYILGQLLGHGTQGWRISQQGTYSPDDNDRWLPSPGIDASGDVAIGFNVSGKKLFPSVRFAGRRATDPAGKLPRDEATAALGGGRQKEPTGDVTFGDYNQMVMEPTNDCRLWFTASFYPNNAAGTTHSFSTAVASFRFKVCAS